ncbi:hypothetical protein [Pedobacter sp. NJ-S-72]
MENTNTLTFASLGLALVALIAAAENDPALKTSLESFKVDFEGLEILADKEMQDNFDQFNQTVEELKNQLEEALNVKESKTDALMVTVDEVKYVVNHGAHPYSREEIADSPEIAKSILKIQGQNAISKL